MDPHIPHIQQSQDLAKIYVSVLDLAFSFL
jgi:hypothetical protein